MMKSPIRGFSLAVCLLLHAETAIDIRAQRAELVVQTGHSDGVWSVSFSSDGKTLATASIDGTIKLWDVKSGKLLRTLTGHASYVWSVSFSSTGRTLASGSNDKTIKLWDIETGKELRTLTGHSNVSEVSFSPDGKILASGGGDHTVKLWDVETGEELRTLTGHSYSVTSVMFSSDGKILASGSYQTLKLWDVETGKELRTLTGHSDFVNSVSFSSDGKTLASGSGDKTNKLWDVQTGKELRTLSGDSAVSSVSFSPDGRTLASGGADIKLWEVESGKELRTLTGHSGAVQSVSFSSDGKTLASGSSDDTIKLWDAESGKELRTLTGDSYSVDSVSISSDGKTLASGNGHKAIKLWDLETGKELRTLTGPPYSYSVSISSDGKTLASGSSDGTIKLWDVESGKELRAFTLDTSLWSVSFSPDGKRLVSASSVYPQRDPEAVIKLWDVKSGQELRTFTLYDYVLTVSISSDGRTLASSGRFSDTISLIDLESGKELRNLSGHSSRVRSLSFSSDGKTLASGSDDRTIKLWDVESGKELRALAGHSHSVLSVSFSSDGRMLASGSEDGKTKLWDVATGQEICSLVALGDNDWAVVRPDGRFDTNKVEDSQGLHWVAPDDPLMPVPLEIFLRDYYEPQLLPRLIKCNQENNCDQEFKPVRDLARLNRVQPPVDIKNVSAPDAEGYVNVTVAVERGKGKFAQEGKEITRKTDVYDLRLFRDGQMVAYWPYDGAQKLLEQTEKDLKVDSNLSDEAAAQKENYGWQQATRVELDPGGKRTLMARVRLPKSKDVGQTQFTAYGFNEDRVKSQTGKWVWPVEDIPKLPKARTIKPRAYVITIGVNASENPNWSLQYAVNDALKMRDTLSARLKELKQLDGLSDRFDVVAFPLVSEYHSDGVRLKSNDATKQKIRAVFDLLAGRKVGDKLLAELLASVPQVGQLRKAEPDDLILISFSSHGYTDRSGNFFILPYDIGMSSRITPDLLAHCISSEELSFWLRDVDAGDMVIVIDACHAAAVTGKGFKPGPMASRGLGQLAYDKGMRILTATQANDFALESGSLGQGLLNYALVENGLKEGRADFKPAPDGRITMNEWLEYGVAQVPTLYDKIKRGELKAIGRGARAVIVGARKQKEGYQQRPSLFDFARKRADMNISVKRASYKEVAPGMK